MAASKQKLNGKLIIQWIISLAIPAILYVLIPTNEVITAATRGFFVITAWGVVAWIFELLPAFITGLLMTLLYILTNVAAPQVAFSSWSNQIVWLIVAGMMVGVAFEKTGLLKRIAFLTIRITGYSYRGIVIGLILSGAIITLLLPNLSARVTLYAFLALGICKALNLKKQSSAGAGIMLAGFLAAVAGRFLIPSGNDETVVALSLMESPVSLKQHLIANVPITLVWMAIVIGMLLLLFRPEAPIDSREYIDAEYKKLGKMSAQEIKFLVMLLIALVLVFTNKVGLGWLFLILACCCFLPGIHILDAQDMGKVNFSMAIFVACALTIGNVASSLNIGTIVADACVSLLNGATLSKFVFYPIVWVFGALINFLMTPIAAVSSFTVPVISVAAATGMSPAGAVYSLILGSEQLLFPYEWAATLFVFSFGMISSKQFLKFGAVRMLLCLIFLLLIAIPYWSLVGFI